jgi:hypothetical protein
MSLALYKRHTKLELVAMMEAVTADPANLAPPGQGIYTHTPAARKKMGAIAAAIAMHMADERTAAGRPVPVDGYSGRQTNKRR